MIGLSPWGHISLGRWDGHYCMLKICGFFVFVYVRVCMCVYACVCVCKVIVCSFTVLLLPLQLQLFLPRVIFVRAGTLDRAGKRSGYKQTGVKIYSVLPVYNRVRVPPIFAECTCTNVQDMWILAAEQFRQLGHVSTTITTPIVTVITWSD